jgi:hypothetical protein
MRWRVLVCLHMWAALACALARRHLSGRGNAEVLEAAAAFLLPLLRACRWVGLVFGEAFPRAVTGTLVLVSIASMWPNWDLSA